CCTNQQNRTVVGRDSVNDREELLHYGGATNQCWGPKLARCLRRFEVLSFSLSFDGESVGPSVESRGSRDGHVVNSLTPKARYLSGPCGLRRRGPSEMR